MKKDNLKRVSCFTLALMMVFACIGYMDMGGTAYAQEITVLVNGTAVTFDQPPIIENGRTLVPLRAIFEALGANVEWEQSTQTVTAVRDDITIILKIGDAFLTKNGERIALDVPAKIVGGRTLVPARAVAESFGASVDWNASTRTVTVATMSTGTPLTPPPTTSTVSPEWRAAFRYTDPTFIEMAIALEQLAGTELRNGKLEGVLYEWKPGYQAVRDRVDSVHLSIYGGPQNNYPEHDIFIYRWMNANRAAVAALAPLAFTDVSASAPYAADLVMMVYYDNIRIREGNVSRYPTIPARFNGSEILSRTEAIDMINQFGYMPGAGLPFRGNESLLAIARPVVEGKVPAWALDSWAPTVGVTVHRLMSEAQVREIVNGNINRLEAANLINMYMLNGALSKSVCVDAGFNGMPISSQALKDHVKGRFSDLNVGNWEGASPLTDNPMYYHHQNTGVLPICPRVAVAILNVVDLGIMSGFPDGTFRPYAETLTKGEFVSMLGRAMELNAQVTTDNRYPPESRGTYTHPF